jgi:uncharacterized protein
VGCPLVISMAVNERAHVDATAAKHLLVGRTAGTMVGLWLLTIITQRLLMYFFAGSTLAAAVSILFQRRNVTQNARSRLAAGFLSGVMGTAAGIGGPPLAYLFSGREGAMSRATLGFVYLLGSIFTITGFVVVGRIHGTDLALFAALIPALALGVVVGRRAGGAIRPQQIRAVVLIILIASALTLAVQAAVR